MWFLEGIAKREFDTDQTYSNPCKTAGELVDWYVRRFGEAIEKIRSLTPTELTLPLTLGGVAEQGGYSFPTYQYLLWVHLHTVHHRGQLTTYLRFMDAKVPSIYGPSADEGVPS